MEAIARERDIKPTTIYGHFAAAIGANLATCHEMLNLEENDYTRIGHAIEQFYSVEEKRLKPVFEALDEVYAYGIIRCVLAELQ